MLYVFGEFYKKQRPSSAIIKTKSFVCM